MSRLAPLLLAALLVGAGAIPAPAAPQVAGKGDGSLDVRLSVQLGWGSVLRSGRWTPMFVTVADPLATEARPRAVRIELEVPQGGPNLMQIRQAAAVGPTPATFTLLVPFRNDYGGFGEGPTVTLRDAVSGKALARWPHKDGDDDFMVGGFSTGDRLGPTESLIGVIGGSAAMEPFRVASGEHLRTVSVPTDRLPESSAALDSLDLLILNRANLNAIPNDRQQAIVEWVRAGGALLMWPGDEPVPAGPLADLLPCRVGQPRDYATSAAARRKAGMAAKFAVLHGAELTPAADAEAIALFPDAAGGTTSGPSTRPAGDNPVAYTRRAGFGRVTVAPIDVARLKFDEPDGDKGRAFFERLAARTGVMDHAGDNPTTYYGGSYNRDADGQRQDSATAAMQDYLGDVPGAGRFGFSYVAWAVLAMMVLVGPVDWFVLKRLGRQPWTWVTTTGWIGLVTSVALVAGHLFKSGDLNFNTIELVDQADDAVVGRVTMTGLYSSRTTTYHVDAASPPSDAGGNAAAGNPASDAKPPAGWWNVASAGGYGGSGLRFDTPFDQSADGTAPGPMTVNVWNLRFLRGESRAAAEPPIVQADLKWSRHPVGGMAVKGTIRNLSNRPLTQVRLNVGERGHAMAASVIPVGPMPSKPAKPSGQAVKGNSSEDAGPPQEAELDEATVGPSDSGTREWVDPTNYDTHWSREALAKLPVLIERLGPGESAPIEVYLPLREVPPASGRATNNNRYRYNVYRSNGGPSLGAESAWTAACDLASARSARIAQETAHGTDAAVLYARLADAPSPVTLREQPTVHSHQTVLRAVVKVKPADGK